MNENNKSEKNIKAVLLIITDKQNRLNQAHDSLESKAGTLVGFQAAIFAALLGFAMQGGRSGNGCLFSVGMVLLLASLIITALSLRTRDFMDAPNIESIYSNEFLSKEHDDLLNQVSSDMRKAYVKNKALRGLVWVLSRLSSVFSSALPAPAACT